jgi:hypothetical protein
VFPKPKEEESSQNAPLIRLKDTTKEVQGKRMLLYSGDDDVLLGVMNALNVWDRKQPLMGSYLAIELYSRSGEQQKNAPGQQKTLKNVDNARKEYFVRILYNDKELPLFGCQDHAVVYLNV